MELPVNTRALGGVASLKNLNTKLLGAFLSLGIIPIIVVGWIAIGQARSSLAESVEPGGTL